MSQVFVSWSGGKDCCLACYRAIRSGHNVRYLTSMIFESSGRLWPHELSPEILRMQARAMAIPMIQRTANAANYDDVYKDMLLTLKGEGISGGVFGDLSIGNNLATNHRRWIDGVCQPTGITPHLPLWGEGRESLFRDFIDSGFVAIIIAVDGDKLGTEYLGRKVDHELLSELKLRYQLSPTGEVGYYHTFVIDGPLFKERLELLKTDVVLRGEFWYLDILKVGLKARVPADVVYAGASVGYK